MKYSVIIPVYNEEDIIADCLSSLDEQKGISFEVLVVDDGSRDKTRKLLKNFHPKNYTLKIISQSHKGAGAARNKAAKKAKGDILIFVDADMTFDRNFVKLLIKPIIEQGVKGTNSSSEYVSNWENVWARCWNYNENWQDRLRHKKGHLGSTVFRAILKEEFNRVHGFSPGGYTDDWSLSEKLGYFATNTPDAVFYHKNPSSLKEVFHHAKWVGKRRYKLWIAGALVALVRASLPVSIFIGVVKSLKHKEPGFLLFKIIYDTGLSIGIIKYTLFRKGQK